jgi:hypothetical protein
MDDASILLLFTDGFDIWFRFVLFLFVLMTKSVLSAVPSRAVRARSLRSTARSGSSTLSVLPARKSMVPPSQSVSTHPMWLSPSFTWPRIVKLCSLVVISPDSPSQLKRSLYNACSVPTFAAANVIVSNGYDSLYPCYASALYYCYHVRLRLAMMLAGAGGLTGGRVVHA